MKAKGTTKVVKIRGIPIEEDTLIVEDFDYAAFRKRYGDGRPERPGPKANRRKR